MKQVRASCNINLGQTDALFIFACKISFLHMMVINVKRMFVHCLDLADRNVLLSNSQRKIVLYEEMLL